MAGGTKKSQTTMLQCGLWDDKVAATPRSLSRALQDCPMLQQAFTPGQKQDAELGDTFDHTPSFDAAPAFTPR